MFWDMKRSMTIDFLEKSASVNSISWHIFLKGACKEWKIIYCKKSEMIGSIFYYQSIKTKGWKECITIKERVWSKQNKKVSLIKEDRKTSKETGTKRKKEK